MASTDDAWRDWGRRDPFFAVLTHPKFRRDQIGEDEIREFFETGRHHVQHVLASSRRLLQDPSFAPRRALDFGCGVGRVALPLAAVAREVVGVDVSEHMLDEARRESERQGVANVRYELSDDTLSRVEGSFDLVHSFIVLQHIDVERGRDFFAQLVERVAPGGVGALHFTYAKAADAARYGRPAPPRNTFRGAVRRWLRQAAGRAGLLPPLPPASRGLVQENEDPQMLMNCYPVNDLLFILQPACANPIQIEFTDHGGELGLFVFFTRPSPAPSRSPRP